MRRRNPSDKHGIVKPIEPRDMVTAIGAPTCRTAWLSLVRRVTAPGLSTSGGSGSGDTHGVSARSAVTADFPRACLFPSHQRKILIEARKLFVELRRERTGL
jgi:hypothetical protein